MTPRWLLSTFALALAVAVPVRAGERVATENFVVDAPTKKLAQQFGEYAEKYRQEKAIEWLGSEMPRWSRKCPLKVSVTPGHTGGATTFTFADEGGRGFVSSQEMKIFGDLPQLLHSVLPHEVTHTVLAHHFGQPVPRWADEGGSVLSENDEERFTHDVRCREVLNQGRGIPLRSLFPMREYPNDMIVLYAQGYSITAFLVEQGGRQKFLKFVGIGMRNGGRNWDEAARTIYDIKSVDELQETWISALRKPPQRIAARNNAPRSAAADGAVASLTSGKGVETRTSAVKAVPQLEPPVVARGATPGGETKTFGSVQPTGGKAMSPAEASATPRLPLPKGLGLLPPEPPSRR